MLPRPEQATEGVISNFQALATAFFHYLNELLVDLVQHHLGVLALLLALRAEGVQKTLVAACREQAALHSQLFHGAGETKTIHQHANAAHDAGFVHVNLIGRCRNVVSSRGAGFLDHGVNGFVVLGTQAHDFVVDHAGLHRAATGRVDQQYHRL